MKARKLYQNGNSTTSALSKEELRQRILDLVNARQRVNAVEIWKASAPNFLLWNAMIEEIKVLDREKKLRREVIAPGNIVIHALPEFPVTKPKANATKNPSSRKTPKRSPSSNKSK